MLGSYCHPNMASATVAQRVAQRLVLSTAATTALTNLGEVVQLRALVG